MEPYGGWVALLAGSLAILVVLGHLGRRMLTLARKLDAMNAMGTAMLDAFTGINGVWAVLTEVVEQVRSDSGSTIKDVTNATAASIADVLDKLEDASRQAALVAREFKNAAVLAKELAQRDREDVHRIEAELGRLTLVVDAATRSAYRQEQNQATVARDLAESNKAREAGSP